MILAPSLLSSDFANLQSEIRALESAGISWLHLDIMDGSFVPNITFGPVLLQSLRARTKLFFDVHLMIEQPSRHLEAFAKAGADLIVVHAEAETHLERALSAIRGMGLKAGVALNPGTDIGFLQWLTPSLDLVLLMSVNPGFSGQAFLPQTYAKLLQTRSLLDRSGGKNVLLQVDGGVSPENARELVVHGAQVLVSGSSFFGHKPYDVCHATFQAACEGVETRPISSWSERETEEAVLQR